MAANDTLPPSTRLVVELLRLGAWLQREGDRIAAEFGLRQPQVVVLNQILLRGPLAQKDLVSSLLLEKSNVSKIVNRLRYEGLVETIPNPEDRRITRLRATRKGRALHRRCQERFDLWNETWLASLPRPEVEHAADLLARIRALTSPGY